MVEAVLLKVWKIVQAINAFLVSIWLRLFRVNKTLHRWLRSFVGEGLVALIGTFYMFVTVFFIWCVMNCEITIKRTWDAVVVDGKVAYETKKAGWW